MDSNGSPAEEALDVLVVGAGPTGLACAIEIKRAGLRVALIDKGCLCNSLFHYPSNMTFFTTPELLEIGDLPFPSPNQKPTRNEALEYYRKAADHYQLNLQAYQEVESVLKENGGFAVSTKDQFGRRRLYRAAKVILATGYYDRPNYIDVPGEDLPKVRHYYHDPHPYYAQDVLVIGGKNSAAIAALDLWRHGARVTLVHREATMHHHVKYWILPDLTNRIKNGEIQAYFQSTVEAIFEDEVRLRTPDGPLQLKNNFVFAMTGYHPDFNFLKMLGIRLEGKDLCPACDPETLESNVPGLYLAGVIVAGARTNEIFIENGRFHGRQIAASIAASLGSRSGVESHA